MRVFIAGASGAIGRLLVSQLVAAGHTVVGMTRSDRGVQALRALGAEPLVADVLDTAAVERAAHGAKPEVAIEELTGLPRDYTPEAMRDALAASNQVRTVGGANVQAAAERVGARRYIAQSGCYYYVPGPVSPRSRLASQSTPHISSREAPGRC
ncbi:MAG TPA: NAD(P)H-binding protein [Bryobacteraceae bacterium]|nr:NAD(P)H-binding protein [Bryobacteraceae bacterium]